jgi:hypothetical protein
MARFERFVAAEKQSMTALREATYKKFEYP